MGDQSVGAGLSARSTAKYQAMLHGVLKRAVRGRVIADNACSEKELPKVALRKRGPSRLGSSSTSAAIPDRFKKRCAIALRS
jgi:hypothetical protein